MKKQLGFLSVFAICSGAMISSGLFVLPSIVAAKIGPAVILVYVLSGLFLIPAIFSTAEMATAMPRTGGTYFFISRILGGMCGTIDGVGEWLALILKSSIALLGFGAYTSVYFGLSMQTIAVILTIVFMLLNFIGTKETALLQNAMIIGLFAILLWLVIGSIPKVDTKHFTPFVPHGWSPLLPAIALVFVSYIGVTKVASVAGEIKNPEKNIPYGIIASFIVVLLFYVATIFIVVGVIPIDVLKDTITPLADAAQITLGSIGFYIVGIAASLAFATTANAGILSASRYLVAMSRDGIIPKFFSYESKRVHTPIFALLFTSAVLVLFVMTTKFEQIAKLASTFQLLVFAFVNLSVIVMRESKIKGYDPGFKSPLYPYMQIFGIIISVVLIPEMGIISSMFSFGLIGLGIVWYYVYAIPRSAGRVGAFAKMTERLAEKLLERDANVMGLRTELRQIIKEKNLRTGDPFFKLLETASTVELEDETTAEQVIKHGATILSQKGNVARDLILGAMLERNRLGETPTSAGIALPHVQIENYTEYHMVIMRSKKGVVFPSSEEKIYAIFLLLGSQDQPSQHLRILAEIARRAENPHFKKAWKNALTVEELPDVLRNINI